jgi:HPt (histidine-containing phosphotransfer) domain-containing protein
MGDGSDLATYCRQLEDYLCRKNDGHLIRIVGPTFEQVCGWAARGVPVKVAQLGIDRYFDRYYAKGPRRRPVQIQFCEADVFDLFDEWRRAVGVPGAGTDSDASQEEGGASVRHGSLPAHVDRVLARLTLVRGAEDRSLDDTIDRFVRELDAARSAVKGLRGEARAAFIARLQELDAELIDDARAQSIPEVLRQLEADADEELAPFRDRMAREVYERSRRAAVDRLIRERRRLPVITFS